jgi:hypothetical protein
MSTGDIDNHLGPEGELERLRAENPDLDAYLTKAWALAPCRVFFIPYGAGISDNGQRPYISNDVQTSINGRECDSALVRHETTEWGLRHFLGIGQDYLDDPIGHRLANRAEAERVEAILECEDAWELYSSIIDPQVELDERQDLEEKPLPKDLALYPYDQGMIEKIKEAMENERSMEEWRKLTATTEPS